MQQPKCAGLNWLTTQQSPHSQAPGHYSGLIEPSLFTAWQTYCQQHQLPWQETLVTTVGVVLSYYLDEDAFGLGVDEADTKWSSYTFNLPSKHNFIDFVQDLIQSKTGLINDAPYDIQLSFGAHVTSPLANKLLIQVNNKQVCTLNYHFEASLFSTQLIAQLHRHIEHFITWCIANPTAPLSDFCLLTAYDIEQKFLEQQQNRRLFPSAGILDWIQNHAKRTPNKIALSDLQQQITYQEIEAKTHQLALQLQSFVNIKERKQPRIAVCLPGCCEEILLIIAILKIGGCFVPLNPKAPLARQMTIMKDSQAQLVIVANSTLKDWRNIEYHPAVSVSEVFNAASDKKSFEAVKPKPQDEVYIIYTSGSSGQPKGIVVNNNNINNTIYGVAEAIDLSARQKLLGFTKSFFDPFIFDLFVAFHQGLTYLCVDDSLRYDSRALASYIEKEQPDFIFATPTLWRTLTPHLKPFEHAPFLATGGEVLDQPLAQALYQLSPNLWNLFGPTEVSIYCSFAKVTTQDISIGRPFSNYELYVLDKNKRLLPPGLAGELYIGGPGLARYCGDETHNKEYFSPFIQQPKSLSLLKLYRSGDRVIQDFEGRYHYLGRIDQQVKIRGQRVEPAEIEAVLRLHPAILHAAVVVGNKNQRNALFGFIELKTKFFWQRYLPYAQRKLKKSIQQHLKDRLPDYMMLETFELKASLPKTATGKIDKQSLKAPNVSASTIVPQGLPTTPHTLLEMIWFSVLRHKVKVRDNFFYSGGDSILAIQLLLEINKRFKFNLPTTWIYEHATIEAQLKWLKTNQEKAPKTFDPLFYFRPYQPEQPTLFLIHPSLTGAEVYYPLVEKLSPHLNVIGINPHNLNQDATKLQHLNALVEYYLKAIQSVSITGPYFLGGWSFGGVLALEIAKRLSNTHTIGKLFIIDCLKMDRPIHFFLSFFLRFNWFYRWEEARKYAILPKSYRRHLRKSIALDFKMLYQYQPTTCDLPVHYFKATEPSVLTGISQEGAANGYEKELTNLTVSEIEANHFEVLAMPHAAKIAAGINEDKALQSFLPTPEVMHFGV